MPTFDMSSRPTSTTTTSQVGGTWQEKSAANWSFRQVWPRRSDIDQRFTTRVSTARAPDEWDEGYIANSTLRYVPDLADGAPDGVHQDRSVWVACETGYRANIAASFLNRDGYQPVVLIDGAVTDVLTELSNT